MVEITGISTILISVMVVLELIQVVLGQRKVAAWTSSQKNPTYIEEVSRCDNGLLNSDKQAAAEPLRCLLGFSFG